MTRSGQESDAKEDKEELVEATSTPKIVEEKLFEKRYVLITGTINDRLAKVTTERLLALAAASDDPINVFISSPGGHVESGDMIHDVIRFINPTVFTIGSGWVASAGALIFVAVERKNRFCLPNTRFLLHQPSGGIGGSASDVEIQAREMKIMRDRFYSIFSKATGQSVERLKRDMERDFWLNTAEALQYGLLGTVVETQDEFLKKAHK
jgi:ATP-dependent Clp protease, protease subunit